MAAKTNEGGHGKGKRVLSPSAPPNINISHTRTPMSPMPLPGSPNREVSSVPIEKPIPHYRLPTGSSSNEVCKCGCRYASDHLTLNISLPGSPKEKPHGLKLPSPRTPTSLTHGKFQPFLKTNKSPVKESSVTERRDAATTSTPYVSGTGTTNSAINPLTQEEEILEHRLVTEMVKEEIVEPCPPSIPPLKDKSLHDSTATLVEEQEEAYMLEAMGGIIAHNGHGKITHQAEQQGFIQNEGGSGELHHDVECKQGKVDRILTDMGTVEKPGKLNFRQRKVMEHKETEDGGRFVQLKFKERGNVEGRAEVLRAEFLKVVLKRQGGQGKKEPASCNDVIEETAMKLVEKRKSKVKALVGAFETAISLQGRR